MLATALLIGLVLTAAITDATRHRIYNWTTYPGIIAGLALAVIGALWQQLSPESAAEWQSVVGWLTLADSLLGFAACGALMTVCFVLFGAGGGDVKLLAMIGSLAGVEKGLEVILWTFVFAGCVGVAVLMWKIGALRLVQRAGQMMLSAVSLGTVLRVPTDEKQVLTLPVVLAPCVPLALLATFIPWPRLL
ncbi:MAG TPA: A24 family peptidase [Pirellulaceae bacterium]|jgi:prepilin peptidase CpaA